MDTLDKLSNFIEADNIDANKLFYGECRNNADVADLSIFYRYCHRHCSQEIKNIIPDPVRRVRTTRSSKHSQHFQATLPNPRTLANQSSSIPRTSQLWNSLPTTTFSESYNLSSFKSNINKLDLVSISI